MRWVVPHQSHELKVVQQERLDQFLELKSPVEVLAVPVYFRSLAEPLDAGVLETLKGFGELGARVNA